MPINNTRFQKFLKVFLSMSDDQLIQSFNKEVGNTGWVSARGDYLAAMNHEFDRRNIDYSRIGDGTFLTLSSSIKLEGRVVKFLEK